MAERRINLTKAQYDLFIWMLDSCERKQGNACEGCGFLKDCHDMYIKVGELYRSNITPTPEKETKKPTPGNPLFENHGGDLEPYFKRVRRGLRVTRRNGVMVEG